MPTMQTKTPEALSKLQHLLDANPSIDWRAFQFGNPSQLGTLSWPNPAVPRDNLISLLKAYQRLLHILPPSEDHRALPLLRAGWLA